MENANSTFTELFNFQPILLNNPIYYLFSNYTFYYKLFLLLLFTSANLIIFKLPLEADQYKTLYCIFAEIKLLGWKGFPDDWIRLCQYINKFGIWKFCRHWQPRDVWSIKLNTIFGYQLFGCLNYKTEAAWGFFGNMLLKLTVVVKIATLIPLKLINNFCNLITLTVGFAFETNRFSYRWWTSLDGSLGWDYNEMKY